MLLERNKKNNVQAYKPQFYCIKVGLKGSKLYRHVFVVYSLQYKNKSVIARAMDAQTDLSLCPPHMF